FPDCESKRVRAKRGPMTGSAPKQSSSSSWFLDCFAWLAMTLRLDHRDDLTFGQHVVDLDQDALDLARRGGGHRDFHLHRLDHDDIVAIADAGADAAHDRTHPTGNFGLDLHFSHFWFLLLFLRLASSSFRGVRSPSPES